MVVIKVNDSATVNKLHFYASSKNYCFERSSSVTAKVSGRTDNTKSSSFSFGKGRFVQSVNVRARKLA